MTTQEIDVLKLYAGQIKGFEDHNGWNKWLSKCFQSGSITELRNVRRGLQMGMASAAKKNLVNESLAVTYTRWLHSIELTIKKIVKFKKGPLQYGDKKILDNDLEKFFREESY